MLAHLVRQPRTSLHKQVGGYMRSDNLQLPCVQPPNSYLLTVAIIIMIATVMVVMVVMVVLVVILV